MKVGSLFAGIGGFDLAAERAGMDVAWQSELDPHASRVLAHHWPDVPNLGDIHDITEPPTVDVLTGGFPCQDYSVAGRGAGLAGDRGALWWQMHRIVAECRPTWVVGENVHGLTTSRHQDSLRTIIGSLVDLGYGVVWRVLDAQWFGVAQRRRRVFIVGHSGGQPRPEILALAQSVCGDSPPSRETGETIAPTLAARTRSGGGLGTDTELDGGHTDALHVGQTPAVAIQGTTVGRSDDAGPKGSGYLNDGSMFTLETVSPHAVAFAQNQRDELRDLGDVAGGLQAEPGMKQQTYVTRPTVRRLTPLECERLQGFPPVMMLDMDATRDEIAAIALSAGHLIVDFDTGRIYRTRGPGGMTLSEPKEWGTSNVNGYRVGTLRVGDVRRQVRAHRVVWIAAHGVPEPGMAVCHANNDKTDNRLANLYLASPEQNSSDAREDGLYEGVHDGRRKLDEDDYRLIIRDYAEGDTTIRALAEKYGVSKSRIHQIVSMRGWTATPHNSDSQRYKQLGNAVAVPVVEWILGNIVKAEAGT